MTKKNKSDRHGFVYSTDPSFRFEEDKQSSESIPASQQKLRISLDTKHRAGKAVTLITGYLGKDDDLQELGKKLKSLCGSGGSVKDGEIIVQGDHREKIFQWLIKNGYKQSRKF